MSDRYRLSGIVADPARIARFDRFMAPEGLVVGGAVAPIWLRDGTSFCFSQGDPPTIVRVDGATGTMMAMSEAERARELPDAVEPPRTFLRAGSLMLPKPARELPSSDRRWFARIEGGNIRLRDAAGGGDVALTRDAIPDFAWDLDAPLFPLTGDSRGEWLPRNPWSPGDRYLFAIKYDVRAVADFPVVDRLAPGSPCRLMKVPAAGAPMPIAHPHLIDVRSREARPLALGATEDHFFVLLGWRPDGSEVLFLRYARNFKTVDLLAGNAATGAVRTVIAERSDTFVAHHYEVVHYGDSHALILPDGAGIVWRSARSGWNHLYLYGLNGTLQRALTEGEFPVIDVLAVDRSEGWVYFTAHHDQGRPYDVHLCRVPIQGGPIQRLTPRDGCNHIFLSPSLTRFVAVNSRPDRPYRTDFHAADGRRLALVEQADVTALDALGAPLPEEFTVLAADGVTELWGVMYKPADFDPAKAYPLIDHLYAGAQLTQAEHHFGLGAISRKRLDRALAQLGYIVISLDARGTPERSKAFQDATYGQLAGPEIPDHAAAIRQLAERHSFIDAARVGVWGHSWGGYYAILAMAQAPDTFRAGVAAAPTPDMRHSFFSETYLDLPARAAAAYDQADLVRWLPEITGRLLVAVGTADPLLDGLKITKGLIEAGIDHDFVVLPGAEHSFRGANDVYFIHKLVKHFETHLKGKQD